MCIPFRLYVSAVLFPLLSATSFAQQPPVPTHNARGHGFELLPAVDGRLPELRPTAAAQSNVGFAARAWGLSTSASRPWMPQARPLGMPLVYMFDDGSYESAIGVILTGDTSHMVAALYLNRFTPPEGVGNYQIDVISIMWPNATAAGDDLTGKQPLLLVYYDADGDGDPANAVRTGPYALVTIDAVDQWQDYGVAGANWMLPASGDLYIGFFDYWAAQEATPAPLYPAALDKGTAQGHSYASYGADASTDVDDLANNVTGLIGDIYPGNAGNWMIRATATSLDGVFCAGFEPADIGVCE